MTAPCPNTALDPAEGPIVEQTARATPSSVDPLAAWPRRTRWFTPAELGRLWGCSTRTIRRRVKDGSLPCHKVNARVWRISEVDAAAAYAVACTLHPRK